MIPTRWSLGLSGLILGACLGLVAGVAISCGTNDNPAQNHQESKAEPNSVYVGTNPVRPVSNLKSTNSECAAYSKMQYLLKAALRFIVHDTKPTDWVIAFATTAYAWIAAGQLRAIRNQSNALIALESLRRKVSRMY